MNVDGESLIGMFLQPVCDFSGSFSAAADLLIFSREKYRWAKSQVTNLSVEIMTDG